MLYLTLLFAGLLAWLISTVTAGGGAMTGVYLAKLHLMTIKPGQFRLYVHILMFNSGVAMLIQVLT